jgi:glutamine synthetase
MRSLQVNSADDAKKIIENRGIEHIKVGVFDMDCIMRGKYMNREKFESSLGNGFGFCDVILGWDSQDQLYDNVQFTGWHTAYPDAQVRLIPQTMRELPMEEKSLLMLGEFSGDAATICPRRLLQRVLLKAEEMGFSVKASCEFEFFLFEETPHSIREKTYQNLKSFTPGNFGYSVLRSSVHAQLYQELMELCLQMDMELESLHTETGPGVLEAAIKYDDALRAADKGALFKTFTKVWAQRRGLMATFMAKWSEDWPGQSGHLHMSLTNKHGDHIFFDEHNPHNMSDLQRWFVGGQQKLMPELMSMVANTVNSYSRMVPGMWAPLDASWGYENRTTALRVINGSPKSQRVEYRICAADINPYIALSAAIGSGLWGIEHKIEPSDPVRGNAYTQELSDELRLPASLSEASHKLLNSQAAREMFGDEFVEHYAQTRLWEEREFRKAVTDWELKRYFEII